MSAMIQRKYISDAWEESIRYLLKNGKWVPTQRGFEALEVNNLHIEITHPLSEPRISNIYEFGEDVITHYSLSYTKEYCAESIKDRFFSYGINNVNQVDEVIRILKNNWYSRRAVISTLIPDYDFTSLHPPCVIAIQFLCRDNKLYLTSTIRSNDAWLAALPDMIALTNIQKLVADALDLDIGSYHQLSVSYHIYEVDCISAKSKLGCLS